MSCRTRCVVKLADKYKSTGELTSGSRDLVIYLVYDYSQMTLGSGPQALPTEQLLGSRIQDIEPSTSAPQILAEAPLHHDLGVSGGDAKEQNHLRASRRRQKSAISLPRLFPRPQTSSIWFSCRV
jgi:hypothetical protein